MTWTPSLIGLTVAYFIVASITTFDIRMIQAKRDGSFAIRRAPSTAMDRSIRVPAMGHLPGALY